MKRFPLIGLSALVGLLTGFALRGVRYREAIPAARSGSSGPENHARPTDSRYSAQRQSSALEAKLRADLTTGDDVARWLHWMTAVEKASAKDFPQLARMAKDMPGAVAILGARWLEMDPQGLFEACINADTRGPGFPTLELGEMLFREWPKKDPEAVLAALKGNPSIQTGWQMQAFETLFSSNPEPALILMSELHINNYGPTMRGVEKWAAADPRHAAEVALAHPSGFATKQAIEAIARQWALGDPQAALAFAASQDTVAGRDLGNHVIKSWVEKDLPKASDWFAAADEKTRKQLLPPFVEAWGAKDAGSALQWCLTNTSGGQQADVIASLVKGSIASSPDAAAAMVAGLEPSPVRTRAALTFAETMLQKGWWPNIVNETADGKAKPEAIAWLGQLDADARKQVISNITWSWSEQDPQGFAEFLRSPAGQDADAGAMAAAARALVRKQPEEAMDLAGQVSGEGLRDALSNTFSTWKRHQPEAAMDWLEKLPASDARREAVYLGVVLDAIPSNAFGNTPDSSPEAARQELARQLATDPAAARETLLKLPMSNDDRTKILTQLRLTGTGK